MKLNMVLSDVGWTLWGTIQASVSKIDFDYGAYAAERWTRTKAKLDSPEFDALLAAVE